MMSNHTEEKVIKWHQINDKCTGLTGRGYKGGYNVFSDNGWMKHFNTKRGLVDFLYEEINQNPEQTLAVGIYAYNAEKGTYHDLEGHRKIIWEY